MVSRSRWCTHVVDVYLYTKLDRNWKKLFPDVRTDIRLHRRTDIRVPIYNQRTAFSALTQLDGWQEGHPARKNYGGWWGEHWLVGMEWCPAGWSVCLPVLIFPCTIKSRSSLLAPAHLGDPGKMAVKRLWCGGGGIHETSFHLPINALLNNFVKTEYSKLAPNLHYSITINLYVKFNKH